MKNCRFIVGLAIIAIGIFVVGCSPSARTTVPAGQGLPYTSTGAEALPDDPSQGDSGRGQAPSTHGQAVVRAPDPRANVEFQDKSNDVSADTREEKTMFTSGPHTIAHVNSANFAAKVLSASRPVLVDFYADWCPPCRMLAPVLQEVAREVVHVDVVKVNVDHDPDLATRYRVSAIPTLILFKDGQAVERITGFLPKQELKEVLAKYE